MGIANPQLEAFHQAHSHPAVEQRPKEQRPTTVSNKLNLNVKQGFGNWLQSHRDPKVPESQGIQTTFYSQQLKGLQQTTPSENNEMYDMNLSHRRLPLSPSEYDTLAESIVSRVKKDLGFMEHALNNNRTHHGFGSEANLSQGQTFVQKQSSEGSEWDVTPSNENANQLSDLRSHKCTVCSCLMLGDHLPVLVGPCGHTVCKQCASCRSACILCGTHMASLTTNIMLQQIIEEFHSKNNYRKSETSHNLGSQSRSKTHSAPSSDVNYAAQLQTYLEREEALEEEMKVARKERDKIACHTRRAQRQLEAIWKEEQSLLQQQEQIENKLGELREHKEMHTGECQRLEEQQNSTGDRMELIEQTLNSLRATIDKIRFLAEAQSADHPDSPREGQAAS